MLASMSPRNFSKFFASCATATWQTSDYWQCLPCLLFQQVISHHTKHTITKHAHIHFWTLHGWFAINDQSSIHFFIHWNGMKWICTTNILSPQFTAIQHNKWAWTDSLLTSQWNCLPPFQPYHFTLRGILCFVRFHTFGGIVVCLNGGGLDLESVQLEKRKVGRATGPQVGERVNAQPMLENGGEGFCGSDTILFCFACKNRLVIAVLIRFKSLCAWIYQMSYSVFPANLWVQIWCSNKWFQNKTAQNYHHQACPYPLLNPPWLIRNQWSMVNNVYTYFSFNGMKWIRTINILSPQFTAIQHNKWAWTASHPTQLPVQLPSTVPTPPLHSEEHPLLRPLSHFWWDRCRPEWRRSWSGVGAESKKGKWAGQLGCRWEKKSMLSQCLMMVVKVFVVQILFYSVSLVRIAW